MLIKTFALPLIVAAMPLTVFAWNSESTRAFCKTYNRDGVTCAQVGYVEGQQGAPWGLDHGQFRCMNGCLHFVADNTPLAAGPTFDRSSWSHWSGKWGGDFWTSGNFGPSQYMTCVATDGSIGAPQYWAAGNGDNAARQAYQSCLNWVNTADRNPAYIEVWCGY